MPERRLLYKCQKTGAVQVLETGAVQVPETGAVPVPTNY